MHSTPRAIRLTLAMAAFAICTAVSMSGAAAYTYKVLHSFPPNKIPVGSGVFIDASGTLYGAQLDGLFALTPNADRSHWTHKLIFAGGTPNGVIEDTAGNLYGTTFSGGEEGGGSVFELTPNAGRTKWTASTLASFPYLSFPDGNLTYAGAKDGALYDGVSALYGTTSQGGIDERGTIFSLVPQDGSWSFTTLYEFCPQDDNICADGADPRGDLLVDGTGNLFGAASGGGYNFNGTTFELSSGSGGWTETVLHTFCEQKKCQDGKYPLGAPVLDAAGELIGSTGASGDCPKRYTDCGTIYKIISDGANSPTSILYYFCSLDHCRDGNNPWPLMMDSAGDFFGVTNAGGAYSSGTVFEFNGTSEQVLYNFCSQKQCKGGNGPFGKLAMDAAGNLFGVAQRGGRKGGGVVFELSP